MEVESRKKTIETTGHKVAPGVANKSKIEAAKGSPAFKAKPAVAPKAEVAGPEALIRERAYFIWEQKGRPHGNDFEIWMQAKKEILAGKN